MSQEQQPQPAPTATATSNTLPPGVGQPPAPPPPPQPQPMSVPTATTSTITATAPAPPPAVHSTGVPTNAHTTNGNATAASGILSGPGGLVGVIPPPTMTATPKPDIPIGPLDDTRKFFLANIAYSMTAQEVKQWFGVSIDCLLCYLFRRCCRLIRWGYLGGCFLLT